MSRFWSSVVHSLSPFGQSWMASSSSTANENPYGPSPRVLAAIASATDRLRLYPDPRASCLCETIAARYDVAPEEVFVGNGSDEVLADISQALLKHDAPRRRGTEHFGASYRWPRPLSEATKERLRRS